MSERGPGESIDARSRVEAPVETLQRRTLDRHGGVKVELQVITAQTHRVGLPRTQWSAWTPRRIRTSSRSLKKSR
eukprot:1075934-Prymnesium_polylepis.1